MAEAAILDAIVNEAPRLSICIATFKREAFIGATLRSIAAQLDDRCEVVIVDGASPDDTAGAVKPFCDADPRIRYLREATNSGVDRDYDKAVGYATGDYCWLMTDDDLLLPGAVQCVLRALDGNEDVLVVNAEVRTVDLSVSLKPHILAPAGATSFGPHQTDEFFAEVGEYLSFIGGTIVRRSLWTGRRRAAYYGSLFIHIGVIFQAPSIESAQILRTPLIAIRYGNAMWTPRTFEIWMFKWPNLVWSFEHIADGARRAVTARAPYRLLKNLLWYRGTGAYALAQYHEHLADQMAWPSRFRALAVAKMPRELANGVCGLYCWLRFLNPARMAVYDLARAGAATSISKLLAKRLGLR